MRMYECDYGFICQCEYLPVQVFLVLGTETLKCLHYLMFAMRKVDYVTEFVKQSAGNKLKNCVVQILYYKL